MSNEKKSQERTVPNSELDLQMIVTDPQWGKTVSPELSKKLTLYFQEHKEDGINIGTEELWELLGFYTRDMRLSNIATSNGELQYCQHYIDLAGDCLRHNNIRAFIKSLCMAITILELTQSKGGFLRKRQGTITSENIQSEEPKKRGIFGMANKG